MLQVLPARLGSRLPPRNGESGEASAVALVSRARRLANGPETLVSGSSAHHASAVAAAVAATDAAFACASFASDVRRPTVVLPSLLDKLQPEDHKLQQPTPHKLRRRALSGPIGPAQPAGQAKPEAAFDALPTQRARSAEAAREAAREAATSSSSESQAKHEEQCRHKHSAPISSSSIAPQIRNAIAASGCSSMGAAGGGTTTVPAAPTARPSTGGSGSTASGTASGIAGGAAGGGSSSSASARGDKPSGAMLVAAEVARRDRKATAAALSRAVGAPPATAPGRTAMACGAAGSSSSSSSNHGGGMVPAAAPQSSGRGIGPNALKAAAQRASVAATAAAAMASAASQRTDRDGGAAAAAAATKAKHKVDAERARAKNPSALTINLKDSKNAASIVREVAYSMNWREAATPAEESSANVFWYERAISIAEVKLLNECQRVNMIPGMHDIAKKTSLAKALNRMRLLFPDEFKFYPMTWTLPGQLDAFRSHVDECESRKEKATFICKPSGGSQGTGIYLTRSADAVASHQNAVVQEYIDQPLLLDGLKFDLRLYVLVLSVQPLTAYLFRQGMARFATNKYKRPTDANLHDVFMHLTNYSLNKRNTAAYVKAGGGRHNDGESSGEEGDDDGSDSDAEGTHAGLPAVSASSTPPLPQRAQTTGAATGGPLGTGRPLGTGPPLVLPGLSSSPPQLVPPGTASGLPNALRASRYEASGGAPSATPRAECWQAEGEAAALPRRDRLNAKGAAKARSKARGKGDADGDDGDDGDDDDDDDESESESESESDDDDEAAEGSGVEDGGQNASKRSVQETFEDLQRKGLASAAQIAKLWKDIEQVCAKTLVACGPVVAATYSSCFPSDDAAAPQYNCFQIVGFDVMIDSNLKPWLIEVNHNPSLTCDTPFDRELKGAVVRGALELIDAAAGGLAYDKTQFKDQLDKAMMVKNLKTATTPLEKERLQQQRIRERREAAKIAASGASRTAAATTSGAPAAAPAPSAAPASAPAAPVREWNPPASFGDFERIPIEVGGGGGGDGYASFELFASASMHRAWRQCVGVRGRKVTAMRFQRLIRDAGLLDARFSAADVDLLFMQTLMRYGGGYHALDDAGGGLSFHEFCEALIEIARRKTAPAGSAAAGGAADGAPAAEPLAKALERVILALPPGSKERTTGPPTRRASRDNIPVVASVS